MSLFFDPESSPYIANTIKSLKNRSSFMQEMYACDPRSNPKSPYYDNRTHSELLSCINKDKLGTALAWVPLENVKELWIVINCGGFAPIHLSHIEMCKSALKTLTNESEGSYGLMSYFIPNNIEYTLYKLIKRDDELPSYISTKHIHNSIQCALEDEPNMDLCTLDMYRKSWCEWYVCVSELINMINYWWRYIISSGFLNEDIEIPDLKFALVAGEDLVRSNSGIYKGVKHIDFVDCILFVPRQIDAKKRLMYTLSSDIKKLSFNDLTLSSTIVRQLLKEKRFDELEKILHPKTLSYLISGA